MDPHQSIEYLENFEKDLRQFDFRPSSEKINKRPRSLNTI